MFSLAKVLAKIKIHYIAYKVDFRQSLYLLGLYSDKRLENQNKKDAMKLVDCMYAINPKATEKLLNKGGS